MKFGHHGANHPVIDLDNGRVMISSQNHGFAVDETTLPANVKATHRSLFDGSLQGIRSSTRRHSVFRGIQRRVPARMTWPAFSTSSSSSMEARAAAAA